MKPFDNQVWQQFWTIASPYWRREEKWTAWGLTALLVILLLAQTRFAVMLNQQAGEFTSALAAQEKTRFWTAIEYSIGLLVITVPTYALYFYTRDRLGIYWRRWLTNRFLDRYFSNRHFYKLNANREIDNPDQRIVEDIDAFTQRSLYFLGILAGSILDLLAFSAVLWSISRELVYFLVLYSITGTMVTIFVFGRVLIGLNFQQLKREADFRFSMVRVRENAESIAFYKGEPQESLQVKRRFTEAFGNFLKLIKSQFFLNLFQYGFTMLNIVLPTAILAPQVLSGELEIGSVVQAAGAFSAVLGAVSLIVEHFEGLSRFSAGISRLSNFSNVLARENPPQAGNIIRTLQDSRLALEGMTLQTPNGERILIKDLSLSVEPGQNIMIAGESGSGKSSLLRAIAGLWHSGSGRIFRPNDILFVPQQPYMILGTLRSQLLYPYAKRQIPDDALLLMLHKVNLPDLAERSGGLDVEMDWEKILSVGEQQRLAIARVLLSAPRYAMLDEATSALDAANEEHLYRQLAETETTLVSIGHRASILKYHTQVLELKGEGAWRMYPAEGYRFN